MHKKYMLLFLMFFRIPPVISMDLDQYSEACKNAECNRIAYRYRELKRSYRELEKEVGYEKAMRSEITTRNINILHVLLDKNQEYTEHMTRAERDEELLKQKNTFLENQLRQAHSFDGWLSHPATISVGTTIMLIAAYKIYAVPRLHAWAQKIRKPTWKKRMLQLLAGDWLRCPGRRKHKAWLSSIKKSILSYVY